MASMAGSGIVQRESSLADGPVADQQNRAEEGRGEDCEGGDPGYEIEAVRGGAANTVAPYLAAKLVRFVVGGAGGDGCAEFVAHVAGLGAADVVAFAEELRATAGAHEAMAEVVVAGAGVGGAHREADGEGEKQGLSNFEGERDIWGSLLSHVCDHPTDEDLSPGTPVRSETWGTHLCADFGWVEADPSASLTPIALTCDRDPERASLRMTILCCGERRRAFRG